MSISYLKPQRELLSQTLIHHARPRPKIQNRLRARQSAHSSASKHASGFSRHLISPAATLTSSFFSSAQRSSTLASSFSTRLALLTSPLSALPPNKFPPRFPPLPRPPLFLHPALPLSRLVPNSRSKDCRPAAVECPRETTHNANASLRRIFKTRAACARAANTRAKCASIVLVLVRKHFGPKFRFT